MGPNKASYCELEDNRDGTFELRIKPNEVGRHVLQVKYGGEHVQGKNILDKLSSTILLIFYTPVIFLHTVKPALVTTFY